MSWCVSELSVKLLTFLWHYAKHRMQLAFFTFRLMVRRQTNCQTSDLQCGYYYCLRQWLESRSWRFSFNRGESLDQYSKF